MSPRNPWSAQEVTGFRNLLMTKGVRMELDLSLMSKTQLLS